MTITVTIQQMKCPKGHTFFPRVKPNGEIIIPKNCPIRYCRITLKEKKHRYFNKEHHINKMIERKEKQLKMLQNKSKSK